MPRTSRREQDQSILIMHEKSLYNLSRYHKIQALLLRRARGANGHTASWDKRKDEKPNVSFKIWRAFSIVPHRVWKFVFDTNSPNLEFMKVLRSHRS